MTTFDQLREAWRIEGLVKRAIDMSRRNFLKGGLAGALGVKGAAPRVAAGVAPVAQAASVAGPTIAGMVTGNATAAPLTRRQLLGSAYRGAQGERLLQLTKTRLPAPLRAVMRNPLGAALAGGVGLV